MFLILIIFLINIDFNDSEQNILLGKYIIRCRYVVTRDLTDGDRQTMHTFRRNETCDDIKFNIPFRNGQMLKKIIIFTTPPEIVDGYHSLDLLKISCDEPPLFQTCAVIKPRMSTIKNIENGVPFHLIKEFPADVNLEFRMQIKEVNISEIEAYSRDNVTHRGCFTNVSSKINFTCDSIVQCRLFCDQRPFGISEPLSSCFCLDEIDFENEVSLSECDATCDDDSNNKCGGNNTHSVYIQEYYIPVYAGCSSKDFFLKYARLLGEVNIEILIRDLTFSKCVRYCGHNHSFFWNGECGCAANYYNDRIDYHTLSCDMPCKFDENVDCGGKEEVSLYRSCGTNNPILCDKLLNCKRAIFDHNGVCTHGCKSGFEGEHCMLKVSDPIPGEIEEPDEEIEVIVTVSTSPISMVTSPDTQDSPTDTQEKSGMVTSPDSQKSITRLTSTDTKESPINVAVKDKSVRIMADNIFSIWVAEAALFFILF